MFFSNSKPKVTFNRCSSLCSLHLSFFIFLHAPRLLLVKLLLHAPSAPKFEGVIVSLNLKHSQSPPLPILCLSSLKSVFFSSILFISVSHLSDLHVLGPNVVALWCLIILVGSSVGQDLLTLLFNSFPAMIFGNCFWKCFWLNPVIMHLIRSLVTLIG